mgnify:CR=1 FL=1
MEINKNPTININSTPNFNEINKNIIDEANKKIMKELLNPKPIFVAFATVDGPSLTKVMHR